MFSEKKHVACLARTAWLNDQNHIPMAYPNQTLQNPLIGQDITFLRTGKETGGALLEMEARYQGRSQEPPPHYHPQQEEDFTVLKGELSVRIDGQVKVLKAGDTLHIPANTVHAMWNHSDQPTAVNWKVRPALHTDQLLETGIGLANDGKTNRKGVPPLLQAALMGRHFSGEYRLARPPYPLQKIAFALLAPIAYLFGYRPVYRKYLDQAP